MKTPYLWFLASLLNFNSIIVFSQSDIQFREKFNAGKTYLANGETGKALPYFLQLYEMQPYNSNINYLLGVCYTEEKEITDKSIFHLEKALKDVSVTYDASSYLETRAPIFVHYFLTIAYSQNKLCDKARQAKNYFQSLYGIEKDDYYISDSKKWVEKCKPEPAHKPRVVEEQSSSRLDKDKLVTKKIEYSTSSPIYGVQIAALSRLAPVRHFQGVKNVEAFMDNNGTIRYVVGHFGTKSQAESLLKAIQESGYKDAFIVDVNKEKKYAEEVVISENISVKSLVKSKERVSFRVQIGAFKEFIPDDLAHKYLLIDGIKEAKEGSTTLLTAGDFSTYSEAAAYKAELEKVNFPGMFVVAYVNDKKISLEEAKLYYSNY
jgi:hypothetical protein